MESREKVLKHSKSVVSADAFYFPVVFTVIYINCYERVKIFSHTPSEKHASSARVVSLATLHR
jgi:hypothetical protein